MEVLATQEAVKVTYDQDSGLFCITQTSDFVDNVIYIAKANMPRLILALEECLWEQEG